MKYKKQFTREHFLILREFINGNNNIAKISDKLSIAYQTVDNISIKFIKWGIVDVSNNLVNIPKIRDLDIKIWVSYMKYWEIDDLLSSFVINYKIIKKI